MSASASGISGGVPSTTQPMAGPWLSPQVVKRKSCPKLLNDMSRGRWASGLHVEVLKHLRDPGRRVGSQHAHQMVAAVDMVHLARYAGREIGEQIEPGAADLLGGDVALQGRVQLVPPKD